MKRIDYSARARFDEFSSDDSSFLCKLISTYDIHSALEIPCANGRNISVLGDALSSAYFADINPAMVAAVRDKIVEGQRLNCTSHILDLTDVSVFPHEIDAIFIMQQGFQMLSLDSGKKALLSLNRTHCRYIVIDTYDFLSGFFDVPYYLLKDVPFIDNDNTIWIRHSYISSSFDNKINLIHEYSSDKEAYYSSIELYNYTRSELTTLCEECGLKIIDYFTDYSFGKNPNLGRTIIILEGPERGRHDDNIY